MVVKDCRVNVKGRWTLLNRIDLIFRYLSRSPCLPVRITAVSTRFHQIRCWRETFYLEKGQSQPLLQRHQHRFLPTLRLIPLALSYTFPPPFLLPLSIRPLCPPLQSPASPSLEIPAVLFFRPFHYRADRCRVYSFDQGVQSFGKVLGYLFASMSTCIVFVVSVSLRPLGNWDNTKRQDDRTTYPSKMPK